MRRTNDFAYFMVSTQKGSQSVICHEKVFLCRKGWVTSYAFMRPPRWMTMPKMNAPANGTTNRSYPTPPNMRTGDFTDQQQSAC